MDENKDSLNVSDLDAPLPTLAAGLSVEDRAELASATKIMRQSLAGQHSDLFENLNPKVRKRKWVEVLVDIQSQHDGLEAKFFEERAALEAKYKKLYEPLYTMRYEIVNGVFGVESAAKENAEETKNKGLPGFWLIAMKADDVLAEEIQEQDEKALKFLKDIKWSRIDDPNSFKLEFFFDSNPYFKNSVLTKTFHMSKIYHMIGVHKPVPMKTTGTEIEWYPGKCWTHKILTQQPEKGSKNAAKPITKIKYCRSFFNFFNTLRAPKYDKKVVKYDKEAGKLIEHDYTVGSTIRDNIIPHAMSWFIDDDFQDLLGDDGDEEVDDEHTSLYSADMCCFGKREYLRSRSTSPESASSSE